MQKAKTNMYLGLQLYLNGTMNIWQVLAVMITVFNTFKTKVQRLQAEQTLQEELIKGYAIDKRNKRLAMAESAFRIKSALQAYAGDSNNMILYNKVNWSLTDLIEGASTGSRSKCQVIHDSAESNIVALATYQVVPEDVATLQDLIDAFNDVISNPKKIFGERKANTKRIKDLIEEIDVLLKTKMDKMAASFIISAPDFYNTYKNERKIYNPKTNFTEVMALFKNKNTGHTLEGVLLKAKGNKGNDFEILSNASGVADKKQISPEIYDFEAEMPGFAKGELKQVKVSPGEKEQLVFELVPVVS